MQPLLQRFKRILPTNQVRLKSIRTNLMKSQIGFGIAVMTLYLLLLLQNCPGTSHTLNDSFGAVQASTPSCDLPWVDMIDSIKQMLDELVLTCLSCLHIKKVILLLVFSSPAAVSVLQGC